VDVEHLAQLRRSYETAPFDLADAAADPFEQFGRWFDEVAASGLAEVNAAVLATATAAGRPSARHVLVKGAGPEGFVLYTNYGSRKATELDANPWAALVFAWSPVGRQVTAEGPVERVPPAESDAYFAARPRDSQLGAWASAQSTPLASRAELDAAWAEAADRFGGRPVPRPPHWGGYRLRPRRIEFWQGRPNRLHDRIVYTAVPGDGWERGRLAP
jgi:pyridoxamine 5'-phosphate oxidase